MTKITIRVDGEMVRQGLEDLSAELPRIGRRRLRTFANRVVRKMQDYPPERPGQRYQRTGNLFYHWKIEETANGYAIENTATRKGRAYPQYVVGDAYGTSQAWMHTGRWSKLRDVVDQEAQTLPPEIEDDIVLVARRDGLA